MIGKFPIVCCKAVFIFAEDRKVGELWLSTDLGATSGFSGELELFENAKAKEPRRVGFLKLDAFLRKIQKAAFRPTASDRERVAAASGRQKLQIKDRDGSVVPDNAIVLGGAPGR